MSSRSIRSWQVLTAVVNRCLSETTSMAWNGQPSLHGSERGAQRHGLVVEHCRFRQLSLRQQLQQPSM